MIIPEFYGLKIYVSSSLTKEKITKINKSWWVRVQDMILRWNPCNEWRNPDFKIEHIPSDEVMQIGNNLYVHPVVADRIRLI